MPNRILREGLRTSRKLAVTNAEGHRMFTTLVSAVDDYGRIDADPVVVRAMCFPRQLDIITVEHVAAWLDQLEAVHLALRYQAGPDRILQLLNTRSRVRANGSKCPDPPPEVAKTLRQWESDGPPDGIDYCRGIGTDRSSFPDTCMHAAPRARTQPCVPALVEDRGSWIEDRGSRSEGKNTDHPPPAGGSSLDADFDEWWGQYPLKEGRKPALLKYRAARRGGTSREVLLEGLRQDLVRRRRQRDAGEFVPNMAHPKTWLGQERWRDVLAAMREEALRAERAAEDRLDSQKRSRAEFIALMSQMRHRSPATYQRELERWHPERRAAFETELDEFERGRGERPLETQAAGGAG